MSLKLKYFLINMSIILNNKFKSEKLIESIIRKEVVWEKLEIIWQ